MNNVSLTGRLTRDPKFFGEGEKRVAKWTVAAKDGSGNTDFVNCLAYDNRIAVVERCKKGTMVSISGKVKTSQYSKNGEKIFQQEVLVYSIEFLEPKGAEDLEIPEDDMPFR